MSLPVTLLPGLHGTTTLFERFIAAAPNSVSVQPIGLPSDQARSYAELASYVATQISPHPCVLVAESFSGPLAILLAAQSPQVVALVLSTSFLRAPLPRFLAQLPAVWRRSPPIWFIRRTLTGGDDEIAQAVRSAVDQLPTDVLVGRLKEALTVDVSSVFQRVHLPVLCLRANRDRLIRRSSHLQMRRLNPTAEFAEIDGPHLLLQTRPADVWHHLARFLANASARAG